jgi:hypothetical protein
MSLYPEKISFMPGKEVQPVDNKTLDNLLEMNPKLFEFALNHHLGKKFRSWGELFPAYALHGLKLQARASLMAELPHDLNTDGV